MEKKHNDEIRHNDHDHDHGKVKLVCPFYFLITKKDCGFSLFFGESPWFNREGGHWQRVILEYTSFNGAEEI